MNDILTEIEVAEMLDCEPSTIQAKARSGDLPGIKIGRSWRFPRAALLESLNLQALANTAAKPAPTPAAHFTPARATRRTPPKLPSLSA